VSVSVPGETPATSAGPDTDTSEGLTRFATAFADAWSSSASSQEQWTRGIRPYVTSALADGLSHTDPAQIPATKVTGDGTLLTSSATSAQVRVPTDGGSILVTVYQGSSGWRISGVAPTGQAPGAPVPDLKQHTSPPRS
jgi:hypothetical protein